MFQVLLYEPIRQEGLDVLLSAAEVHLASATDEDTIIREIREIDGVVIRAQGRMSRRILENAPRLKIVGRHGVGVDNVDIEACTEHGVQVVNTPLATVEGVAEHTLGLMLAASKRMAYADRRIREGGWQIRYTAIGNELLGKTVGIVGFGRIGRRVAEVCHRAFNMRIIYSDVVSAPEQERDLGARRVELDELLQTADYVTVHVPLMPSTQGMFGGREFDLMRSDAYFFNCSRGPVVDEAALYEALAQGKIAGAGIDVFEQEPTPEDNPLFELENVVLTPHMATATVEAMIQMSLVTEDIIAYLQGKPIKFPVNKLS
ncbi:MAG: hydroxyacid dehydrogenase [Anaerolineae bacterium]|nr:hydroxyacid dehydrogenase [Anaerolineae bacterium]